MFRRYFAAVIGLVLAAAAVVPARAGDQPAVAGVNAKADIQGGGVNRRDIVGAGASVTVPIRKRFGAQVDAAGGEHHGKTYAGAAAHVFARDPKRGMVGLYGSYLNSDLPNTQWTSIAKSLQQRGVTHVARVGVESSIYAGRFAIDLRGGVQRGLAGKKKAWGRSTLAFYPTKKWRVAVGQRYSLGRVVGFAETERALPVPGLNMTAFTHVEGGPHDRTAFAGVRIYFGGKKSLKDRHREDDPESAAFSEDILDIDRSVQTLSGCRDNKGKVVPC